MQDAIAVDLGYGLASCLRRLAPAISRLIIYEIHQLRRFSFTHNVDNRYT